MALNKNINEAYPAFVGGGNAVQNGKTNTQPSSDMVSPQNIENSTLGGSEAVVSDTRHMFDFVNGKGDYGVFGRDFSYSISSLALVNPYAAGAVVGVLGAGSLIYGIMTSAYVRSKQTLRRLRTIRNKVLSPEGYPIDNMNSFGIMKFLNFITDWIGGGDEKKVGVKQFYDEINGTITSLENELNSLGLNSVGQVDNLTPGGYEQKRAGINKVLNASYKDFYIASGEVSKASDRYKKLLSNNRFKYDKNVEESYDKLMKRMQESNVNAPLYKRRDEYAAQINELGESLVNAFDTKMGYALKRGGNRAISCSKKLHATWKDMMKEISGKLDEKVDEFCVDSSSGLTKAQNIRNIIEALYIKDEFPLTIDTMSNELYVGSFFMYRPDGSPDGTPVLLSVGDYDKDKWEQGLIVMKIVNSDIISGGMTIDVPIKYVDDFIHSDRDSDNKKSFNIGKRRKTDKFVRMKEIDSKSLKTRRWYRVNYRGSEGMTAANGMWTAVVYVFGIVDGGVYGTPGTQYVQYRYANYPTHGAKGGGTVQVCEKGVFEDWIISELDEYADINANESYSDFYDGYSVLNEYSTYAIYEDDGTDIDNSSSTEASSENAEKNDKATDDGKKSSGDKDTEEDKRKKELDNRFNAADKDEKNIKNLTLDGIDGKLKKHLNSIGSADKGTYVLLATDDRPIVYTKNPIPGRVELYEKYSGKDSFTWEEWEKLCPLQIPFETNPYDNTDLNDILLDDGVDDVKGDGNYPLTYGVFGGLYMHPKYMFKYANIFSNNSKELKQYDIIVDRKTKRCTGLCKSNLGAVYGKYSLSVPSNFKTYLIQCIASEVFIKDEDEMSEILKDSSTTNESFSVKDIKRLFEGRERLLEKQAGSIDNSANDASKGEPKGVKQIGDGNVEVNGNNNKIIIQQGYSIEQIGQIFGIMLQYGAVGAAPQQLQQIKKEADEHKDASAAEEVKKEPIAGIPDIVRKVCIEILRDVRGFTKKYDDGVDRTKFNNPPRAFRGIKSNIEELLGGSHNDEYGVSNISDISENIKHNESNKNLLNPKWVEQWTVDTPYSDKYEPVFYFSKDSSANTNDKDSEVKEYTFFVRDKAVVVSDIKKFDEKLSLKCDGVTKKDSDQNVANDLKKANISFGTYYELPIEKFKAMRDGDTEKSSNESYGYSDEAFYKLFEDENEGSDSTDVEISDSYSGGTVLLLADNIKDGKVEFKCVSNGELKSVFVAISSVSKIDLTDYEYDYSKDASIREMYNLFGKVCRLSKEGYVVIEKFIKDKTSISKIDDGSVLVIPIKAQVSADSSDFVPLNMGGIIFSIGNTTTGIIPLLYIHNLMRGNKEVLTYIEWASTIVNSFSEVGLSNAYYKMSKSDFDKSFGKLVVEPEEPAKSDADKGFNEKVEDNKSEGYNYDIDYIYKLYEDDSSSVEVNDSVVNDVYIEVSVVGEEGSENALNKKYVAECKTDIQLKDGSAGVKTREFTLLETEISNDIKLEVLNSKPDGWDEKEDKATNGEQQDTSVKPYPEAAIRPYTEGDYNQLIKLNELLENINFANDTNTVSSRDKELYINACISYYANNMNKNSMYRNIRDYAEKIKSFATNSSYNIGSNPGDYYEFIMLIINKFLSKEWSNDSHIDINKAHTLMYVNDKNKWVSKNIRIERETSDELFIVIKTDDKEEKYVLPKDGYNYMICESLNGYPTMRYRSGVDYMKHTLYGIPLKESVFFDFGSPKSFNLIKEILISIQDNLLYVMESTNDSTVRDKIMTTLKSAANGGGNAQISKAVDSQNNVAQPIKGGDAAQTEIQFPNQ